MTSDWTYQSSKLVNGPFALFLRMSRPSHVRLGFYVFKHVYIHSDVGLARTRLAM